MYSEGSSCCRYMAIFLFIKYSDATWIDFDKSKKLRHQLTVNCLSRRVCRFKEIIFEYKTKTSISLHELETKSETLLG